MGQKIFLLQIAALGYNFLKQNLNGQKLHNFEIRPLQGLFPALTCTVQATMRTASSPNEHGIVGNGFFFKEQWKPLFWEQSSRLIQGNRIWNGFRSNGGKVAQMFIQQSLGPETDILLSPAPIHKHHGGMILECFSVPAALNGRLKKEIGAVFPLYHYWGPLASIKSSQWIVKGIESVMKNEKPDFLYAYVPHMDYALQRFGPDSDQSRKAYSEMDALLKQLLSSAEKEKYQVILFGDYPITPARDVIFPNKTLYTTGLLKTRKIKGMHYPDYYTSAAFCIVDHQIAHLHIFEPKRQEEVKGLMENLIGVDRVLDRTAQASIGLDHPRSGDLVLVAKKGYWFDYRWWEGKKEAPDYATHIDIHNKPGYDPCELFWGWPPPSVSQNPSRIKGTHGRVDEEEPVFYASNIYMLGNPKNLLELSKSIKLMLDIWQP